MKGVYKDGGASAFYKGSVPRALKSALNIAVQFFLYDALKRIADVAPDDLKVIGCVTSAGREWLLLLYAVAAVVVAVACYQPTLCDPLRTSDPERFLASCLRPQWLQQLAE